MARIASAIVAVGFGAIAATLYIMAGPSAPWGWVAFFAAMAALNAL